MGSPQRRELGLESTTQPQKMDNINKIFHNIQMSEKTYYQSTVQKYNQQKQLQKIKVAK
jgi:hypothetical protein